MLGTFDSSLLDGLSPSELKLKLAECLELLAEKERDITIAAEIGSKLVEENTILAAEKNELRELLEDVRCQSSISSTGGGGVNNIYDTHTAQNTHNNNTTTAATPPTTTTTNHTLSRRKSVAIFDQITLLERENCLLKSQLDESSLTKQELDQSSQRTISSLRKANTKLQADLVAALTNQRDGEIQHSKIVDRLEQDVQGLKQELEDSLTRADKAEQDRKRLLLRNAETLKEKNELESSDAALLTQLGDRVAQLDTENSKLRRQTSKQDRDFKELMEELAILREQILDVSEQMQEMERLKREHQEQAMLIEYLEQELEMERQSLVEMRGGGDGGGDNGVDVEGRRKSLEDEQQKQSSSKSLSTTSKDNGSWTSWMDRYWIKIWERDITGLKSEISDLRETQSQTITRIRDQIEGIVGSAVDRVVPTPVKTLGSILASGGDPALSLLTPQTLAVTNNAEN